MAFRNEALALAERVESLEREVQQAREELRARDAAHAPSRAVAWLLQPHVVMPLLVIGSVALLPAGQMMHRKAVVRMADELRPARIRTAIRNAAPEIAAKCVPAGRAAEVDVLLSVDDAGNVMLVDQSAEAKWGAGVGDCVAGALPRNLPSGSRPIDVTMKLRLLSPETRGPR